MINRKVGEIVAEGLHRIVVPFDGEEFLESRLMVAEGRPPPPAKVETTVGLPGVLRISLRMCRAIASISFGGTELPIRSSALFHDRN